MGTFRKEYKELTEEQKIDVEQIKKNAERLEATFLACDKVDPRMIAIAKTKLEESIMWAVKAVTN